MPTEKDMAALLTALGVRGKDRARLFEFAKDAADPNWLAPGGGQQLALLMEYERTATRIIYVELFLFQACCRPLTTLDRS